ncbi:hypothetical protein [Pararhodospirillum photometricum]|uniref:Uncharacterized protein n=1 Tax=Pararhodospirillum photometricum DSM 122 TaxID=1150469 RepID=H6SMM1_PARPM|nr:hypothetical protein [Pararhodospirillum photometricum]CCG09156.1 unnamed protein product [Pararhodospirillum photometricum DSM 122]
MFTVHVPFYLSSVPLRYDRDKTLNSIPPGVHLVLPVEVEGVVALHVWPTGRQPGGAVKWDWDVVDVTIHASQAGEVETVAVPYGGLGEFGVAVFDAVSREAGMRRAGKVWVIDKSAPTPLMEAITEAAEQERREAEASRHHLAAAE